MAPLRRANLSRRKIFIPVLCLISAGLLLLPSGTSNKIRLWVGTAFQPFQGLAHRWSLDLSAGARRISEGLAGRANTETLDKNLRHLQNKYLQLQILLADKDRQIQELTRVNTELKSVLGGTPLRIIPARVISHEVAVRSGLNLGAGANRGIRQNDVVIDCFLDKGTEAGLEAGLPVITGAGFVGTIKTVGPVNSLVQPATDPASRVRVMIVRCRGGKCLPGALAIAQGTDDGRRICLKAVGRGEDVQVGDWVVTAPVAEAPLPPYLIVGHITRCDLKPAALLYDIEVEPRPNFQDLSEVYILDVAETPKSRESDKK